MGSLKIKVAICDDSTYYCGYIKNCLSKSDLLEYVGEAYSSEECKRLVADRSPDVLLLDVQMEQTDSGIRLIPYLKELRPGLKIIILTNHDENEYILEAFVNGANDYMLKSLANDDIISSIKNVYTNTAFLKPDIAALILNECREYKFKKTTVMYMIDIMTRLSATEFEVLQLLCSGKSYRDIAAERFVEESTIRSQTNRILKKLDFASIRDLVDKLREMDIFSALGSR